MQGDEGEAANVGADPNSGNTRWCYAFSKAIWLAADLIFRPVSPEELEWHRCDGTLDDRAELPHL
jgi:hypothetical protein